MCFFVFYKINNNEPEFPIEKCTKLSNFKTIYIPEVNNYLIIFCKVSIYQPTDDLDVINLSTERKEKLLQCFQDKVILNQKPKCGSRTLITSVKSLFFLINLQL